MEVTAGRPVWAFGVMTGTSMDAVDVAIIRTDGETVSEFGDSVSKTYPAPYQACIAEAMAHIADLPTEQLRDRARWPRCLHEAESVVRRATDYAVESLLFRHGIGVGGAREEPWLTIEKEWSQTCSGVHGQTMIHRPEEGFTLQIGDRLLVKESGPLGLTVTAGREGPGVCARSYFHPDSVEVYDFRSADMEAGGQGAPLAPFYHFALARRIGATEPMAFLNIGGVANVTWIDPTKERPEEPRALLAFDTGPGNALINDWMMRRTGMLSMDLDGGAASTGRVHRQRLRSNSAEAYLRRRPPKSLDRNDFAPVLRAMEGLTINDGAATLTAFTADCVAAGLRHMPSPPARWLVCGGGRKNATMMRMLAARLEAPVEPVEALGLDGDMLEAQAFAYLAVRVLRGLPTSAPGTTGCRAPVSGGRVSRPEAVGSARRAPAG